MLYLIGLGLGDEKDISLRALEIGKKCECYIELYTSKWFGSIDGLSKLIGKKIKLLKRKDLEENLDLFIKLAVERDIALFVPGDPLAATTHSTIVLAARRAGIEVKILHNASIFSAIAEAGLHLYKFGRTVTVPFSGKLQAVCDALRANKKAGLHTLLLLDVDAEVGLYMRISDALKMLLKGKIVKPMDKLIAAAQLGTPYIKILYRTAKELLEAELGTPAVLIIPGRLHFHEKEFLESL